MNITPKKKPGRPRKIVPTGNIINVGLAANPTQEDYLVELTYSNPLMFKKFLRLFSVYKAVEVELNFTKTELIIVARDHLNKSTIYTRIFGQHMNLYYCKQEIKINVNIANLNTVFSVLGANHDRVSIILREDYRSMMYVEFNNIDYNNIDLYDIPVNNMSTENLSDPSHIDNDYPIKFKLSMAQMKNHIKTIIKFGNRLVIQKIGTSHLQFTIECKQSKQVNWCCVYDDENMIDLKSSIEEGDIFSISITIVHIKPLTVGKIGDHILVAAHQNKCISFTIMLDQKTNNEYAGIIKIFTQIS